MEFLEGFEYKNGRLAGRILTPGGVELVEDLGQLRQRGLPSEYPYTSNRNQILELNTLEPCNSTEYLKGLGLRGTTDDDKHDVFIHRQPKLTFLIPALALARGLFPLVPVAFESMFSPRSLTEMCIPFEKNGQWTVEMASFQYKPKQSGVPLPMREALTWASLYRSGDYSWHSVYANARKGRMRIALPAARTNVLMHGIKTDNTIYVTSLKVAALLAYDQPFEFAAGAPHSFLPHQGARSLYGPANAYYSQRDSKYSIDSAQLLSDDEWDAIEPIFEKNSAKGGEQLISRRILADAFIKRMVTAAPWTDSFYAPLAPKAGGKQWRVHRLSGQLQEFIDVMHRLRPNASYLSIDSP